MTRGFRSVRAFILAGWLALCLFVCHAASAACTNPTAVEGTVVYNADQHVPQVCAGSSWVALGAHKPGGGSGSCSNPTAVEGAIVYNQDYSVLQYCDGTNWKAVQAAPSGGCTPDPACPNVGDVCSGDGSGGGNPKFAGCICYYDSNSADAGSCKALYVTQASQSTSSQWKTTTGTDDIATDSAEDGKINDSQIANSSTFPAFKLCKDLTDGGYSDWYLPARKELHLLWYNSAGITGFAAAYHWTSSEYDASNVWALTFSDGNDGNDGKTLNRDVRCVRRD
jgi:hypothetical protein